VVCVVRQNPVPLFLNIEIIATAMPQRREKRRSPSKRGNQPGKVAGDMGKLVTAVQTLVTVQKSQERSTIPVVMDVPRIMFKREKIVTAQREYFDVSVSPSTSGAIYGAIDIYLTELPNYTEFTALYDQYRIIQATVNFIPGAGVTQSTAINNLITVVDYNDAVNLGVPVNAVQYPSLMESNPGSFVERTVNPHMATAAYSGAFTSYTNQYGVWIDASSPSVQHYGVKYLVDTSPTAVTAAWTVLVQVVFQVRNLH